MQNDAAEVWRRHVARDGNLQSGTVVLLGISAVHRLLDQTRITDVKSLLSCRIPRRESHKVSKLRSCVVSSTLVTVLPRLNASFLLAVDGLDVGLLGYGELVWGISAARASPVPYTSDQRIERPFLSWSDMSKLLSILGFVRATMDVHTLRWNSHHKRTRPSATTCNLQPRWRRLKPCHWPWI